MYFLVSTSCAPRACVLRDLTNEHKVTKFEQEEEDDDEVGCQDEMPRILFPLPAPARACVLRDLTSSSCARALVCCVISRTSIMSRNLRVAGVRRREVGILHLNRRRRRRLVPEFPYAAGDRRRAPVAGVQGRDIGILQFSSDRRHPRNIPKRCFALFVSRE